MSGGHCLLALCSSLHEFTLLGETVDDSPGEALDKCARMLGLHHLPGLRDVSGGRAIEIVARYSTSSSWFPFFSLTQEKSKPSPAQGTNASIQGLQVIPLHGLRMEIHFLRIL